MTPSREILDLIDRQANVLPAAIRIRLHGIAVDVAAQESELAFLREFADERAAEAHDAARCVAGLRPVSDATGPIVERARQ